MRATSGSPTARSSARSSAFGPPSVVEVASSVSPGAASLVLDRLLLVRPTERVSVASWVNPRDFPNRYGVLPETVTRLVLGYRDHDLAVVVRDHADSTSTGHAWTGHHTFAVRVDDAGALTRASRTNLEESARRGWDTTVVYGAPASNEDVVELTRLVYALSPDALVSLAEVVHLSEIPVLSADVRSVLVGGGELTREVLAALREHASGTPAEWAFRRLRGRDES